jgi:prolyl 4-hydroxylase
MHHASVSVNYPWLPHNMNPEQNPVPEEYQGMVLQPLGNRQAKFEEYIQGCVDHYGGNTIGNKGQRCINNEEGRVEMSLRQPKSMVNYTTNGFTKMRAPENVFKLIQEFWQANKHREKDERWAAGNVYVNHWDKPTGMVSVEDESLEGGGYVLKQHIVRTTLYYMKEKCLF